MAGLEKLGFSESYTDEMQSQQTGSNQHASIMKRIHDIRDKSTLVTRLHCVHQY